MNYGSEFVARKTVSKAEAGKSLVTMTKLNLGSKEKNRIPLDTGNTDTIPIYAYAFYLFQTCTTIPLLTYHFPPITHYRPPGMALDIALYAAAQRPPRSVSAAHASPDYSGKS